MPKAGKPVISARRAPRQARSTTLVADILDAALRVLGREGAQGFNTVRVAEEAGVSVGSLYQYFPNKEALLFRLQADEWNETWGIIDGILGDPSTPPVERLRRAAITFFRSEQAEAKLRLALDDAGAHFRSAPEARALSMKATQRTRALVDEALPEASPEQRIFAADFVFTSLSAIAEKATTQGRSDAEIEAWAETTAEMLCVFVSSLRAPS